MGKAVGAVTNVVKKIGGGVQGDVMDPLRGKYNVPQAKVRPDYKVDRKKFQALQGQRDLLKNLQKQVNAPIDVSNSVAQQQLKQGTNRNLAQLAGSVAGARGPNQALALRTGLQQQAASTQDMVGQSGILRANEYQQAVQNKLALQDQLSRAFAENQRMREAGEGLRANVAGAGQQANLQAQLGYMDAQSAANKFKAEKQGGLIKDLAEKAATFAAKSDKTSKKDIKPAALEEIMTKLNASKFKYKQPNGESYQDGEVTGIMAQDLEKSELGEKMVVDSPEGKMVDLKKAVPVTMAAVSEIMKRIKKLEKSKQA